MRKQIFHQLNMVPLNSLKQRRPPLKAIPGVDTLLVVLNDHLGTRQVSKGAYFVQSNLQASVEIRRPSQGVRDDRSRGERKTRLEAKRKMCDVVAMAWLGGGELARKKRAGKDPEKQTSPP